jgi:archaemetzincin
MESAKGTIVLVPVGPVSPDLLGWLQDRLVDVLSRPVTAGKAIPLPGNGYDERRGQVRGEAILRALRTLSYPAAERVLGLTEADCYARELNHIFGQASLNGRQAFVALPRLRSSFYGLADDPGPFHHRALKECIHELGHTWAAAIAPTGAA